MMVGTSGLRNNVAAMTGPGGEMREVGGGSSDEENWSEREQSRTHSVKFSDEPPEGDKEVSRPLAVFYDASSYTSSSTNSCNDNDNNNTLSYYLTCLLWRAASLCMRRSASYGSLAQQ